MAGTVLFPGGIYICLTDGTLRSCGQICRAKKDECGSDRRQYGHSFFTLDMGIEVLTGLVGRNVDELIRQIKAMQEVAKNPGKAAPAGWKPGDKLIGTGKDFIGKY